MLELLLIAGLTYGGFYYTQLSAFAHNAIVSISKIAIDSPKSSASGWGVFYYNVTVNVVNPIDFALNIESVNLDFYLQGVKVGSAVKYNIPIRANSTTSVVIPLSVPIASLITSFGTVVSILTNSEGGGISFTIKGNVKTLAGSFVINQNLLSV